MVEAVAPNAMEVTTSFESAAAPLTDSWACGPIERQPSAIAAIGNACICAIAAAMAPATLRRKESVWDSASIPTLRIATILNVRVASRARRDAPRAARPSKFGPRMLSPRTSRTDHLVASRCGSRAASVGYARSNFLMQVQIKQKRLVCGRVGADELCDRIGGQAPPAARVMARGHRPFPNASTICLLALTPGQLVFCPNRL